jgi:hypothetical protein
VFLHPLSSLPIVVSLKHILYSCISQDMRIQELQMELQAVSQRSATPSSITAVSFPSASSVMSAPEYLASLAPPVAASTTNSSSPSGAGILQQTSSTQVNTIAPLKHSSSGVDMKTMGLEKRELHPAGVAGRAIIHPDQDYHPTYQLQQFLQPNHPHDLRPEVFDSGHSTLLQMQVAGIASPISGQVYSEQSSADQIPQSGQHMLLSHNAEHQRFGKATLQEQLAEVQKQLQMLSSGPQAQVQPYLSQGSQPHIQFNSDTQWGTTSAADDLQFFA